MNIKHMKKTFLILALSAVSMNAFAEANPANDSIQNNLFPELNKEGLEVIDLASAQLNGQNNLKATLEPKVPGTDLSDYKAKLADLFYTLTGQNSTALVQQGNSEETIKLFDDVKNAYEAFESVAKTTELAPESQNIVDNALASIMPRYEKLVHDYNTAYLAEAHKQGKDEDLVNALKQSAIEHGFTMLNQDAQVLLSQYNLGGISVFNWDMPKNAGFYARTYGFKRKNNDASPLHNDYHAYGVEAGYAHSLTLDNGAWLIGASLLMDDGRLSMDKGLANTKIRSYSGKIFSRYDYTRGSFVGLTLDAKRYQEKNLPLGLDQHRNLLSVSLEGGHEFRMNSLFMTPEFKFTWARLSKMQYVNPLGMSVTSEAITSKLARVGVVIGLNTPNTKVWGSAHIAHEFAGEELGKATLSNKDNGYTASHVIKNKGTWSELAIGGDVNLSSNVSMGAKLGVELGGKHKTNPNAMLNVRFAF